MAANPAQVRRPDVSDYVVHLTKGATDDAAFQNLLSIVDDRSIRGNTRNIRGDYQCVCFTEAPLLSLAGGLLNTRGVRRYSPFGIAFAKSWLFAQGGRPVIYQSDAEFQQLPENLAWRHMRYEPDALDPIDFAWEREWRIQAAALDLAPTHCAVVLPNGAWSNRLREAHHDQQDWQFHAYAELFDMNLAQQLQEDFPWSVFELPPG